MLCAWRGVRPIFASLMYDLQCREKTAEIGRVREVLFFDQNGSTFSRLDRSSQNGVKSPSRVVCLRWLVRGLHPVTSPAVPEPASHFGETVLADTHVGQWIAEAERETETLPLFDEVQSLPEKGMTLGSAAS